MITEILSDKWLQVQVPVQGLYWLLSSYASDIIGVLISLTALATGIFVSFRAYERAKIATIERRQKQKEKES